MTNDDLIRRQDAIDIIDMDKIEPEIAPSLGSTAERDFKIYNHSCNKHIELIKQLPSAQRNGKWIDDTCTECGYGVQPWNNTPFCPRCGSYNGADMRGDEDENN